jgi:hypothetical protein
MNGIKMKIMQSNLDKCLSQDSNRPRIQIGALNNETLRFIKAYVARPCAPIQSFCHATTTWTNAWIETQKHMHSALGRIKSISGHETLSVLHVHACSSTQKHFHPEIHKNHTIG